MGIVSNSFLDFCQINELLPNGKKILSDHKVSRTTFITQDGEVLPVAPSKLYQKSYYWFSSATDKFIEEGANNICFVCGYEGICIIPISIVKEYNRYSGWKPLKKYRSYYVRIKKLDHQFFLYSGTEHEDIDVTPYFISYKNETK